MGGERETVVAQKRPAKTATGEHTVGKIRIHESGGEVHFHDDARSLKVAIPTATWFSAWENLSCGKTKKFEYVDNVNKAIVTIRCGVLKSKKGKLKDKPAKEICAYIELDPVQFSNEFQSLSKFSSAQ